MGALVGVSRCVGGCVSGCVSRHVGGYWWVCQ